MGQNESRRPSRNGNQVAVDALDAFRRDCSPSGTVVIRDPSGESNPESPTSRTSLVNEKCAPSGQYGSLICDTSSPPAPERQMNTRIESHTADRQRRQARRVAPRPLVLETCPCCPAALCALCSRQLAHTTNSTEFSPPVGCNSRCWPDSSSPSSMAACDWAACRQAERNSSPDGLARATGKLAGLGKQLKCAGSARNECAQLAQSDANQLVAKGRESSRHPGAGPESTTAGEISAPSERYGRRLRQSASVAANVVVVGRNGGGGGNEAAQSISPPSSVSLVSDASSSSASLLLAPLELRGQKCCGRARNSSPPAERRHERPLCGCDAISGAIAAANSPESAGLATIARTNSIGPKQANQLVCDSPDNVNNKPAQPNGAEISGDLLDGTGALTATVAESKNNQSFHEQPPTHCLRCREIQESTLSEQQQQQQQQNVKTDSLGEHFRQHQQATCKDYLAWNELTQQYRGKMSRRTSLQPVVSRKSASDDQSDDSQVYGAASVMGLSTGARRPPPSRSSCLCHILCALLQTLFPILNSLKHYSLPGDLAADMAAGFTVAVLHIPQGMAYGLLSGVEPIYGLYVSFIPVLVMSLMSSSRHVSYGTFAVISMLLVNTIENVRSSFERDFQLGPAVNASQGAFKSLPLVITDNHQPVDGNSGSHRQHSQVAELQPSGANFLIDATGPMEASLLAASPPTNIEILACACLVCGLIHITMSLMRLGVLSLMFSDQLVSSFTTASAIHVLTSQLAGLFDLKLAPIHEELFKIVRIWWQFGHAMLFESFNRTTALLSIGSIAFLLLVKELVEPALRRKFKRLTCLPSELVLMAIVILCSWRFKFESALNVKIIGHVPTGLPEAQTPRLELVPYVLKDSLTIALISFAMNLSIAQVYAKRFRYELDANQELFALGSANILSSFFNCFPCASSLSRSSVQSSLNVRSQLCSLFSCAVVVLIICFFAHILHDLPRSTLSCIIVVALKGILMQVRDLYDNWRLSKLDALVWVITFLSVIVFGVTFGLILGIAASLFMIFLRLLTPNHSILGRLPNSEIYVDAEAFPECEQIERVKIFRFNSALCYLNRTQLRTKIEKLLPSIYKPQGFGAICSQLHQRSSPSQPQVGSVSFLIIDCSALSYCDYSGAATLVELVEDLESEKVKVFLAACPLKLIDMLGKMKSTGKVLNENIYPTISVAVGQVRYLLSARQSPIEEKASPLTASLTQTPHNSTAYRQSSASLKDSSEPTTSSILDLP